jgi:putative transcriptional regulator
VFFTWLARLILAAMIVPAALLHHATPTVGEAPAPASLAGQFLIASPSMSDPRFQRTVILMVQHGREGALGIVINRPVGERLLADLMKIIGEKDTGVPGTVRLFAGGPVQLELGFVVHSAEYLLPETIALDSRVAVTSSRDILRDIANNKGPNKSLIAFGYAGWSPGQLEGELKRQFWVTAPANAALIFDEDRDKVYDAAYARRTLDL